VDELEALADDLAGDTTQKFIEHAKSRNAYLRTKLGNTISRLAHPAGIHRDELKRHVIKAMREYVGEMDGYAKYEQKPGNEGAYAKHWRGMIGECLNKLRQSRNPA
jgi:hypothetical protein